jgi:hypothetical protein
MFDFTLHARIRCYFLFHKYVLVVFLFYYFSTKKKLGEKIRNFNFSLDSFLEILHVFLPDISVHYALIKCAYI